MIGSTTEVTSAVHRYPWMCSIRTYGYNGRHRCGATLLSGPPKKTVLVSAAHCNYICKNDFGEHLEMCCCRASSEPGSCRDVRYSNLDFSASRLDLIQKCVSVQFLLPRQSSSEAGRARRSADCLRNQFGWRGFQEWSDPGRQENSPPSHLHTPGWTAERPRHFRLHCGR